jgi:hypothetical protein
MTAVLVDRVGVSFHSCLPSFYHLRNMNANFSVLFCLFPTATCFNESLMHSAVSF